MQQFPLTLASTFCTYWSLCKSTSIAHSPHQAMPSDLPASDLQAQAYQTTCEQTRTTCGARIHTKRALATLSRPQ